MPASNFLVGTAPDQVPTNADLGEMAFQSKDAVEFTGGKGGLSHLDITAISAQLNVNATDVFVYDTSKDSDGGAWRNRCQHTSWFNETLNTATRGARREFPSVAVIVATTSSITIYDGDDPALPMWMVFVGGSAGLANTVMLQNGNGFCVAAVNAVMATGVSTNTDNWGSPIINFISEKVVRMDPHPTEGGTWLGAGIAERNLARGYASQANSGGYVIGDSRINDVAMTVLPNAPIDAATGLPVPTIAVATGGGVSIIHNTGVVANIIESGGSAYATVAWTPTYGLLYSQTGYFISIDGPNVPQSGTTSQASMNSAGLLRLYQYDATIPAVSVGWQSPLMDSVVAMRDRVIALDRRDGGGLALLAEAFQGSRANGMVDWVTSKYNTGWMPGDIKGAWLSDTVQETVVGSELVTNGDFASNLSGWTTSGTTAPSISNGGVLLTTGVVDGEVLQAVSASQARWWLISWTVTSNSGGYFGLSLNQSASQTGGFMALDQITTSGVFQYYGSITSIAFRHRSSGSGVIDNISLRPCDPNRSVSGKGLQVFGSITKTPVAAGADLVAYSGWSGSNYLKQPYNSSINFGTGDFFLMAWFKSGLAGTYNEIFDIAEVGSNAGRLEFLVGSLGNLYLYTGSSGTATSSANGAVSAGVWNQLCAVRRSGVVSLYVNGSLVTSAVNTGNLNNTNTQLFVGINYNGGNSTATDQLALLRISATAPSDAQIKKMYEDEKYLFQDNAKATLYGTSDAVTALAYDEDTQLLHVGTSSGRSVFDGLRRVDNTTTAVSATISAANGLVVEN